MGSHDDYCSKGILLKQYVAATTCRKFLSAILQRTKDAFQIQLDA